MVTWDTNKSVAVSQILPSFCFLFVPTSHMSMSPVLCSNLFALSYFCSEVFFLWEHFFSGSLELGIASILSFRKNWYQLSGKVFLSFAYQICILQLHFTNARFVTFLTVDVTQWWEHMENTSVTVKLPQILCAKWPCSFHWILWDQAVNRYGIFPPLELLHHIFT